MNPAGPADVIITVRVDASHSNFISRDSVVYALNFLCGIVPVIDLSSLLRITAGGLARHLSNPMTTFTKLSSAEAPGISIHSNRRISKINPNIYAGFTEYVHRCFVFVFRTEIMS